MLFELFGIIFTLLLDIFCVVWSFYSIFFWIIIDFPFPWRLIFAKRDYDCSILESPGSGRSGKKFPWYYIYWEEQDSSIKFTDSSIQELEENLRKKDDQIKQMKKQINDLIDLISMCDAHIYSDSSEERKMTGGFLKNMTMYHSLHDSGFENDTSTEFSGFTGNELNRLNEMIRRIRGKRKTLDRMASESQKVLRMEIQDVSRSIDYSNSEEFNGDNVTPIRSKVFYRKKFGGEESESASPRKREKPTVDLQTMDENKDQQKCSDATKFSDDDMNSPISQLSSSPIKSPASPCSINSPASKSLTQSTFFVQV